MTGCLDRRWERVHRHNWGPDRRSGVGLGAEGSQTVPAPRNTPSRGAAARAALTQLVRSNAAPWAPAGTREFTECGTKLRQATGGQQECLETTLSIAQERMSHVLGSKSGQGSGGHRV